MSAVVFGRDIECRYCDHVHDASAKCGAELRDKGMALVVGAEASDWPAKCERWVLAQPRGKEFTAEDITTAIGRPERPNSVGARLSAMARMKWIEPVGYVKANRAERHASRMLVWRRI
jgi:hypothetical protein